MTIKQAMLIFGTILGLTLAFVLGHAFSSAIGGTGGDPEQGSSALQNAVRKGVGDTRAKRREQEEKRISEAMKQAARDYRESVELEKTAFERSVRQRAEASFGPLRDDVPSIAGRYGYDKAWQLVKALTMDKLKPTSPSRIENVFNADLSDSFYVPLLQARQEVWGECAALAARLEALRAQYAKAVNDIAPWNEELGAVPQSLAKESMRIQEQLQTQIGARISSAIQVAVEAIFLKQGIAMSRRVLAGAVKRFAASAGAGLIISQCDSPAPGPADVVGAAVFGIGFLMTCREVKKACVDLPRQVADTMNDVVDGQEREIVAETLREGRKLIAQYQLE